MIYGPGDIGANARPVDVMMAYLGVRETGPNRGPWVDEVVRFVGMQPPQPWCAAGLVWCCHKAGVYLPKSASVLILWDLVKDRRIAEPEPGCAFVHISPKHRHTGLWLHPAPGGGNTISCNTNAEGSAEGDRVGLHVHPLDYFTGFFHTRPAPFAERVA